MTSTPHIRFYEFDGFRLDTSRRVLTRDGLPVTLTAKSIDLLLALITARAQVLEKDELIRLLWPDTVVEEGNLTVNISSLRKALGESPNERRFIATVPGRGYRFIAAVREVGEEGSELIIARRTTARVVIETEEQEPRGTIRLIAVLPFKPLSLQATDEYLGLGIADALITRFGRIGDIMVRPTSAVRRYAEPGVDALAAGRDLGVDAVLDGHVQRADDRLRLTTQLVSVGDGTLLWAEKFDAQFTDIFAIQDSISEQVVHALLLRLTGDEQHRLLKQSTTDPEAYQLYLKGIYQTNKGTKEGAQKGIEFFNQAAEKDPGYAGAYAGLADAWCWLSHLLIDPKDALPNARAAALKALELDEGLGEAHLALGLVKMWYEWQWEECEVQFQRALQLNPSLAAAHIWYGFYLASMAEFDRADSQAGLALELDPLSLNNNTMRGWLLYFARRYDLAAMQFQTTIELEPTYFAPYWGLGWTLNQQGRYDEAIAVLREGLSLGGGTEVSAALSYAYARAGRTRDARRVLDELYALRRERYVSPFYFALSHIGLMELDETFVALEKAYEDRFEWLVQFKVDPVWEPVRFDPRYTSLIQRLGLG